MARLGETGDGVPSVPSVSGFEHDLADLIEDHFTECGGDLSFNAFRERWTARCFSFTHNARLVELLEAEYVQMLFTAALPYLAPEWPTVRRITGLYALHLLYHTQQLTPRVRIYVTPRDVLRMSELVNTCVDMGVVDAVKATKELVDDHALAVGIADRKREEALEDALLVADAGTRVKSPQAKTRQKKRKAKSESEDDVHDIYEDTDPSDDSDDPFMALTARVASASKTALEHLRKARVPDSFAALSETSTKYGAVMADLRGSGSSGKERSDKDGRPTGTTEMHELVRRQVVKYDGKLRAALRPETDRDKFESGIASSRELAGDVLGAGDLSILRKADRSTPATGLSRLKPRTLKDTPRFGSMPEFPKSGFADDEANANETKNKKAEPSRLQESDEKQRKGRAGSDTESDDE